MTTSILIGGAFVLTYLGMAIGRLPGLQVDRAWIAFGAAVLLLASGAVPLQQAGRLLDWEALLLLLGMMVVSAQFEFSGVYQRAGTAAARLAQRPLHLLATVVLLGGGLSAILVNDIVAFALTPVLLLSLRAQGRDPVPYLLALACACNAGSAASLIGNPQNILIGQAGRLDFWGYVAASIVPAALALASVFAVIAWLWRGHWTPAAAPTDAVAALAPERAPAWKPWLAIVALLLLFSTPLPRELSALLVAVLVMASRRQSSREYLAAVDWSLLLLFAGLFVVTGAAGELPWAREQAAQLAASGQLPQGALSLAGVALLGSNLIGNVPFVMLLLQVWPQVPAQALVALALLSTLAGNLLIVGSVVNLIVAESARRHGLALGFMQFARVGIPVTLLSMSLAVGWLVVSGTLPLR
ncbi:SLC13 family permease [Panacagrimonas sp.]|uniref:SLC13 family permease n=1 Tax=Panacagrimonas sp. TaxID=2480088 RepID=UPI003B521A26